MKDSASDASFDLKEFLPFQMSVIASRLFQMMIAEAGVQLPEWRIIMVLPKNQPCSSNDLCHLTAMDAARVSRAQRRLEELGLVEVAQDSVDRRRLVVRLSETGMHEYQRLLTSAREAEERLLEKLPPEDRFALRTMVAALHARP